MSKSWFPNSDLTRNEIIFIIIFMIVIFIIWYFAVQKEGGFVPKEYQQEQDTSENVNIKTNTSTVREEE